MYVKITTKNLAKQHVLYTLTTMEGKLVHIAVVPLTYLGSFTDVKAEPQELYLSIIKISENRINLMEHALAFAGDKKCYGLKNDLTAIAIDMMKNKKDNSIICVETGEIFKTAMECSTAHDLTYSALLSHLKQSKSHRTVKGRTYRKAAEC